MKYLKNFNTTSEYNQFKEGDAFILPNVSYVTEDDTVYFNAEAAVSQYIMVDLGLPSGTLWADRNIGASSPEEAGLYFQWGDTVGWTAEQIENNTGYYYNNYWDNDGNGGYVKYTGNLKKLESSDDAATVNMGSDYRMPTKNDFYELYSNCTIRFVAVSGNEYDKNELYNYSTDSYIFEDTDEIFKGIKLIGPNGNSIFLPATNYMSPGAGMYYTSELYSYTTFVYAWYFTNRGSIDFTSEDSLSRKELCNIRGVQPKQ